MSSSFEKITESPPDYPKERKRFKKYWEGQSSKTLAKIYLIPEEQFFPQRAGERLGLTLYFLPKVVLISTWLTAFSFACMVISLFMALSSPAPKLYVASVGGHVRPLRTYDAPIAVDPATFEPVPVVVPGAQNRGSLPGKIQ